MDSKSTDETIVGCGNLLGVYSFSYTPYTCPYHSAAETKQVQFVGYAAKGIGDLRKLVYEKGTAPPANVTYHVIDGLGVFSIPQTAINSLQRGYISAKDMNRKVIGKERVTKYEARGFQFDPEIMLRFQATTSEPIDRPTPYH